MTYLGAEGKYFTQYEMIKEPEQERFTTVLTISYADLARSEDVYVFIPSLRRYLRVLDAALIWEPTKRRTTGVWI